MSKSEPIDERRFSSSLVPMSWHYEQTDHLRKEIEKLRKENKKAVAVAVSAALFWGLTIIAFAIWALRIQG